MLIIYLTEVQHDFKPPLFQRIIERSNLDNIEKYVEKVLSKANVFVILDQDRIIAAIAIYTNNAVANEAYIPILSVKDKYKGKGYASKLLERAVQCAKEFEMKVINVKTWPENKKAIILYTKNGFKITQKDEVNLYFKKEI